MALAVHGFYGRGGSRDAPLPTANADVVEKVEKLTEAVTDLQKAQQHNAVAIQSVVQRVEDIVKSVDELKNHLSPHAQPQIVQPPPSKRIPSELSGAIKCIYAGMSEEQQYKVHENYRSDHNEKVSTWLLSQIKKLAKLEQYSDFHSRAIYRYYESRRRKFKDSAEGREERVKTNESKSKKRRSQKKLYLQRASVLKDSEKERWSQLDLSYMTDESDAEYNHRSVKQTHKPTWRSAALNRLIVKLDKRLAAKKGSGKDHEGFKRKERIAGLPSKSELPCGAPQWAVIMLNTDPAATEQQLLSPACSTSSTATLVASPSDLQQQFSSPAQSFGTPVLYSNSRSATKPRRFRLQGWDDYMAVSSDDDFSSD
ncbi:hypothetical protein EMCRGX_G018160 [Ephydatia muelleri]